MELAIRDGITIAAALISLGGAWALSKDQGRQMKAIWKWKEEHEKESSDKREQIANRFGKIEAQQSTASALYQSQSEQINQRFDRLEEKIDRLIDRRG